MYYVRLYYNVCYYVRLLYNFDCVCTCMNFFNELNNEGNKLSSTRICLCFNYLVIVCFNLKQYIWINDVPYTLDFGLRQTQKLGSERTLSLHAISSFSIVYKNLFSWYHVILRLLHLFISHSLSTLSPNKRIPL